MFDELKNKIWCIDPSALEAAKNLGSVDFSAENTSALVSINQRHGIDNSNTLGVINISGVITSSNYGFGSVSVGDIKDQFLTALENPNIEKIVFAISSPGGTVSGIRGLSKLIYENRGAKPIISFTETAALSAAYWIGSSSDEFIIGDEIVSVGSMGVVYEHEDMSEMLRQNGITRTEITAGKYKRLVSNYKPLSEEAKDFLTAQTDEIYRYFISDVARNRGVTEDFVRKNMAEGRTFLGNDAIKNKLVDRIATFESLFDDEKDIETVESFKKEDLITASESEETPKLEEDTMDIDKLKKEHSEVFAQAYEEGVNAERERIKKIDNCKAVNDVETINAYKYHNFKTAENMAYEWACKEDTKKAAMMDSIQQDSSKVLDVSREEASVDAFDDVVSKFKGEGLGAGAAILRAKREYPQLFKQHRVRG